MFYDSSCFPQGNNKSIWSFLSFQAGHQLTCIFIHFTVSKGLKSKNWGNRHLWGIWGKSVELQFGMYGRGEGGIFFLISHCPSSVQWCHPPLTYKGTTATDAMTVKLNCLCCCWTMFSIKPTLLPLLLCRSATLIAGGYSNPNAYGCLKGKCWLDSAGTCVKLTLVHPVKLTGLPSHLPRTARWAGCLQKPPAVTGLKIRAFYWLWVGLSRLTAQLW